MDLFFLSDNPGSSSYSCNPSKPWLTSDNPYICEIGDWSGKIATDRVQKRPSENKFSGNYDDYYGFQPDDLSGKSIVFHCPNAGTRIFCANFELINEVKPQKESIKPRLFGGFRMF